MPQPILKAYHLLLALGAAFWYGRPSEHLTVIGVTGTKGKSTTVQYVGRLLEHAGYKVGWTSTAGFKVGDREWANAKKMTMLGRFQTQKLLREMVDAGCTHAVVETSSQGVDQFRHAGINYDMAVFTNLTPEHIEAHGGFENYKKAKGKFFAHVAGMGKTCVVNIDDEHAPYFLSFPFEKKFGYGFAGKTPAMDAVRQNFVPVLATDLILSGQGSTFSVDGHAMQVRPIGLFNVYNVLAAISVCRAIGFSWEKIEKGIAALLPVPGRLEFIDEGQDFSVVVDYAYEPAGLQACFDALRLLKRHRMIHVLGSAGGGRDVARRTVLGAMTAKESDIVIVTNEDPYDDDPRIIMDQVAEGAMRMGKEEGIHVFRVLDRQTAIDQAVALAKPGDLVLLTGKGSEPVMAVARGKYIPWDERAAARRALQKRMHAV